MAEVNEQDRIKTMAGIINDVRNPLEGATQFNLEEIVSCEKVAARNRTLFCMDLCLLNI